MKIICISDTHNMHQQMDIPDGDVIIHAGDFTDAGTKNETQDFLKWFSRLKHQHKILVAGNHDFYLEKNNQLLENLIPNNINYLQDSGICIDNVNFWGSPYTPGNGNWAFNRHRGSDILKHWNKIPSNIDFLITHSPPYAVLDELDNKRHIGCESLIKRINELKIPHHIFGHVHDDYGIVKTKDSVFINASSVDGKYRQINAPLVVHHLKT